MTLDLQQAKKCCDTDIQAEVSTYPQHTSLEWIPVSEGFEDCPDPDARSLAMKYIFKMLIKKNIFFRGAEYIVQQELWLL